MRRQYSIADRFCCTLILAIVVAASSGCASRLDTRGNLLDPDRVVDIKPGELSRQDVADILGSPSSVTPFGSDTWYYVAQRTETFAFFAPKVMERQVIVIRFDDDGKVAAVDARGLEHGRAVKPIARTTPTHGNEMTVLEQLIGNLGRFSKDAAARKAQEEKDELEGKLPY